MPSRILIAAQDEILRNILVRFLSQLPVIGVACGSVGEALGYLSSGHVYHLIVAEPQLGSAIHSRHPSAMILDADVPLNLDELGRRVRQVIGGPVPPERADLTRQASAAAFLGSLGAAGHLFRSVL